MVLLRGPLKCLNKLFKDSPARRDNYTSFSETFPSRFCVCHWFESFVVVKRALDVLPSVIYYNFIRGAEGKDCNRGQNNFDSKEWMQRSTSESKTVVFCVFC